MCSSIKLTSLDNNIFWFRTCDMDLTGNVWYLGSKVISIKEKTKINLSNHEYITKYSVLGISYGKPYTRLLDGINQEGLIGGLQALQEGTSVEDKEENYIGIEGLEIVTWFLTNCKNTQEIIQLAEKTQVLNIGKETAKAHYIFNDKEGYSLILEATKDGKFQIYDKTIGIMTNSKTYPEQIKKLQEFMEENKYLNKLKIDNIEIPFDHLKREKILPGDYESESRFIKLALLKHLNEDGKVYTDEEMLHKGINIINSVVVPYNKGKLYNNKDYYTQYIVVYDMKNLELYLKTEDSLSFIKYKLSNIQEELQIHKIIHDLKLGIIEEI